jgi:hypothetical protein
MKSRMWEICSYGSVRDWAGNCPVYSTQREKKLIILDDLFAIDNDEPHLGFAHDELVEQGRAQAAFLLAFYPKMSLYYA